MDKLSRILRGTDKMSVEDRLAVVNERLKSTKVNPYILHVLSKKLMGEIW